MAKEKEVEVRNGTVVVEISKRIVSKGSCCYNDKLYDVKQDGDKFYIDLYNMADYPDEAVPLDPELERLLSWFVTERKQIAETFEADEVWVDDEEGVVFIKRRRRINPLAAAALALGSSLI